jgi:hypothetical protein
MVISRHLTDAGFAQCMAENEIGAPVGAVTDQSCPNRLCAEEYGEAE